MIYGARAIQQATKYIAPMVIGTEDKLMMKRRLECMLRMMGVWVVRGNQWGEQSTYTLRAN